MYPPPKKKKIGGWGSFFSKSTKFRTVAEKFRVGRGTGNQHFFFLNKWDWKKKHNQGMIKRGNSVLPNKNEWKVFTNKASVNTERETSFFMTYWLFFFHFHLFCHWRYCLERAHVLNFFFKKCLPLSEILFFIHHCYWTCSYRDCFIVLWKLKKVFSLNLYSVFAFMKMSVCHLLSCLQKGALSRKWHNTFKLLVDILHMY